jgi:antitoxin ParD1/3/4
MNVSLTPELEKWIERCVKSGRYASSSEVVRAGLQALMDAQGPEFPAWTREELRVEIQKGMDDIRAGRVSTIEDREALLEEIKQRGLSKLKTQQ